MMNIHEHITYYKVDCHMILYAKDIVKYPYYDIETVEKYIGNNIPTDIRGHIVSLYWDTAKHEFEDDI